MEATIEKETVRVEYVEENDFHYAKERLYYISWIKLLGIVAVIVSIAAIVLNSIHISTYVSFLLVSLLVMSVFFFFGSIAAVVWAQRASQTYKADAELFQPRINDRLTKGIFVTGLLLAGAAAVILVNIYIQQEYPTDHYVAKNTNGSSWNDAGYDGRTEQGLTKFSRVNLIIQGCFAGFFFFFFLLASRAAFRCLKWSNQAMSYLVFLGNVLLLAFGLGIIYFAEYVFGYGEYPQIRNHFPVWNIRGLYFIGIAVSALSLIGFLVDHRSWRVGFFVLAFLLLVSLALLANFTGYAYRHSRQNYEYYKGVDNVQTCVDRMKVVHEADLERYGCPQKYLPLDKCDSSQVAEKWEYTNADTTGVKKPAPQTTTAKTSVASDNKAQAKPASGQTTTSTSSDGTTTTTHPDGTQVTSQPSGTTTTSRPDGSSTTTQPDGTTTNTQKDGTSTTSQTDGTTTITNKDGTTTTNNPDGSTTTTNKDGTTTTTKPDGTTVTTSPDGTTTTKSTDGTTVTKSPNGTTTTKRPDGSTEVKQQDGTTTTRKSDGTTTTKSTDGTTSTTNPDGTTTTTEPDGTTTTRKPDGTTTTTQKDGTVTTTNTDGSSFTKSPDGTTTTRNKDGSKTVVKPDGTTTTTSADGKTVTTTQPDGTTSTSTTSLLFADEGFDEYGRYYNNARYLDVDSPEYCLNTRCCGLLGQLYTNPLLGLANFGLLATLAGCLVSIGCYYFWYVTWVDSARDKRKDFIWLGVMLAFIIVFFGLLFGLERPYVHERLGANSTHL